VITFAHLPSMIVSDGYETGERRPASRREMARLAPALPADRLAEPADGLATVMRRTAARHARRRCRIVDLLAPAHSTSNSLAALEPYLAKL
jgi:hypothetical protein